VAATCHAPLRYRNWLIDELSRFDAPVDLVGHSLAGGYVLEQTPGDGERHIEQLFSGGAGDRAPRMAGWGHPGAHGRRSRTPPGPGNG